MFNLKKLKNIQITVDGMGTEMAILQQTIRNRDYEIEKMQNRLSVEGSLLTYNTRLKKQVLELEEWLMTASEKNEEFKEMFESNIAIFWQKMYEKTLDKSVCDHAVTLFKRSFKKDGE